MSSASKPPASRTSARRLKVLHIVAQLERGGAELRLLDLLRALDRGRYEFHFLLTSGLPGSLDAAFRDLGVTLHHSRLGPGFLPAYMSMLLEQRFDVVHSHVYYASGVMLRLAQLAKVGGRFAHFRSSGDGHEDTLARAAKRALAKHWIHTSATKILSVSEGALELAWSADWRADPRCLVLYNGLTSTPLPPSREAIRRRLDIDPTAPLIMHVGTLIEPKNHDRLLEIFAAYVARVPDATLLLAGRDPHERAPALLDKARSLGLSNGVRYLGERLDVTDLLYAADALLFPSIREGLPGAVLEACEVGTPVLGSDLPGVEEIARHFPSVSTLPLSTPNGAWADRLERVIREHGAEEQRAATRAAFASSPFTVERAARAYEAILDELGA